MRPPVLFIICREKNKKNSLTLPSGRGENCSPDWGEAFLSLTPGESGRCSKRSKVDENSVTHGRIPPPPGLIQHPQLKSIRPAGLSRGRARSLARRQRRFPPSPARAPLAQHPRRQLHSGTFYWPSSVLFKASVH